MTRPTTPTWPRWGKQVPEVDVVVVIHHVRGRDRHSLAYCDSLPVEACVMDVNTESGQVLHEKKAVEPAFDQPRTVPIQLLKRLRRPGFVPRPAAVLGVGGEGAFVHERRFSVGPKQPELSGACPGAWRGACVAITQSTWRRLERYGAAAVGSPPSMPLFRHADHPPQSTSGSVVHGDSRGSRAAAQSGRTDGALCSTR